MTGADSCPSLAGLEKYQPRQTSLLYAADGRLVAAIGTERRTLAKLGALRHLVLADEPLTLSQLAERHCCVKSNVTQLVDKPNVGVHVRMPKSIFK